MLPEKISLVSAVLAGNGDGGKAASLARAPFRFTVFICQFIQKPNENACCFETPVTGAMNCPLAGRWSGQMAVSMPSVPDNVDSFLKKRRRRTSDVNVPGASIPAEKLGMAAWGERSLSRHRRIPSPSLLWFWATAGKEINMPRLCCNRPRKRCCAGDKRHAFSGR